MRLNLKVISAIVAALIVTGAVSAAPLDGKWNGNLRCDASPTNPAKLPAFSNPISMVVANNAANMTRNTDVVTESLSGKILAGGMASLSGNGRFKAKEGTWAIKIDGKFSGNAFSGTGAIYRDDGGKVRDCFAELAIEAAQAPKAAKAPEPMPAVAGARPTAQQEAPAVVAAVQSQSAPPAPSPEPAKADTNPLAAQIDAKSFIGTNALRQETLWSDPKQQVFGKRTADWTEQDFQLLDQKLRDQLAIERNVAVEYNRRVGLKTSPDDNSLFKVSRQYLQDAISAVPQFKSWADQARQKGQAEDAQRLAQERSRQAEEANRKQQEQANAARSNAPAPNTSVSQAPFSRSVQNDNGPLLQIFLVVVAAALAGWIWNKFMRARCPKCKSTAFDTAVVAESAPFKGTKQVREKNSRGTNTRHVQTTYVKRRYAYRCKICQHEWFEERREEL
jgi:hypothetical protein